MRTRCVLIALAVASALACGHNDPEPIPSDTGTPSPSPSPAPSPSPTPFTPAPTPAASPTPTPTPIPSPRPAPSPGPAPSPPPPPTSSSGRLGWSAPSPGPVYGVGADKDGHVFAAIERYPSGGGQGTAALVRYAPGGAGEWSLDVAPGGFPLQLTVMPGGDAVVAVCSAASCTTGDASARISIVRVAPTGQPRWTKDLPGNAVLSLDSDVRGRTLAIVAFWDVARNDLASTHAMILGDDGGVALDLTLDVARPSAEWGGPSGDFALAGQDVATSNPVFERVGSDGTIRWRSILDTTAGGVDRIAFAEDGTIALIGWFQERIGWAGIHHRVGAGQTSGFLLVASGDGSPKWGRDDPAFRAAERMPAEVRLGPDDEIVVFTTVSDQGAASLRAFSPSGTPLWGYAFRGASGTWVGAAAVGRNGDIVVGAKNAADAPFQALRYAPDVWYVAVLSR